MKLLLTKRQRWLMNNQRKNILSLKKPEIDSDDSDKKDNDF
jgi:hypothetical protein